MKRAIIYTSSSSSDSSINTELTGSSLPKVSLVERNPCPNGVSLVNPKYSGKSSCQDIVSLAKEIQQANSIVSAVTCGKLKVISEQIKRLQEEALEIMEEGLQNLDLHKISCNFIKIPGGIYHLYERDSKQKYFSMLSPKDWNSSPPHTFLGSYRLNYDRTWTQLDNYTSNLSSSTKCLMEQFDVIRKKTSDESLLNEVEMDTESLDHDFSLKMLENTSMQITDNDNSIPPPSFTNKLKNSREYL